MTTSNMSLEKPAVLSDGPTWAASINTNSDLIDLHDHSTGKGKKISQAGIIFSGNFTASGYAITDLSAVRFSAAIASPTVARGLEVYNGDLWFVNGSAVPIQLTSGSGINIASVGTIGGDYGQPGITASVVYSDLTKSFQFTRTSGVGAEIFASHIVLQNTGGSQSVKITAPSSVTAYTITLPPALPLTSNDVFTSNTSGVSVWKTITGTSNRITVSQSATAITLTTPQDIHTGASPTFVGLTLSGLSANTVCAITTGGQLSTINYSATNNGGWLVLRDGNGDFSAGTITASLTGNVTGNVSGNISGTTGTFTGDVSGVKGTFTGEVSATTGTFSGGVSAGSGSPTLKFLKLTGTAADFASYSHGLTESKIINIFGKITDNFGTTFNIPRYSSSSADYVGIVWASGAINLTRSGLNTSSTNNVTLLITYEA